MARSFFVRIHAVADATTHRKKVHQSFTSPYAYTLPYARCRGTDPGVLSRMELKARNIPCLALPCACLPHNRTKRNL